LLIGDLVTAFSYRTVRIAVTARKLRIIRLMAAIAITLADDDPRTLCFMNAPIAPSSNRPKGGPSISANLSVPV